MNKLTVFKNAQGWHVRFDEGDEREGVVAVMGTDTIPLPFTAKAKAETVLADIQQRYPGADITFELNPGMGWNVKRPSWTVPGEVK